MEDIVQTPVEAAAETTPTLSPAPPVPVESAPAPVAPPQTPIAKKSNTGLLVILGVVVIALLILGGVTYFALQGSDNAETQGAPTTTPTPTLTTTPTPTTSPNSDRTGDIKKELDQTTVTDPATEVDSLTSEVNKL